MPPAHCASKPWLDPHSTSTAVPESPEEKQTLARYEAPPVPGPVIHRCQRCTRSHTLSRLQSRHSPPSPRYLPDLIHLTVSSITSPPCSDVASLTPLRPALARQTGRGCAPLPHILAISPIHLSSNPASLYSPSGQSSFNVTVIITLNLPAVFPALLD
jgi:hypothetical protein